LVVSLSSDTFLASGELGFIFLQEVSSKAFPALLNSEFMKNNFYITDVDHTSWRTNSFGSVTFVRRAPSPTGRPALRVASVYRIPYHSHMDRDARCCDILISGCIRMRAINVHLDDMTDAVIALRRASLEASGSLPAISMLSAHEIVPSRWTRRCLASCAS
jgi:hypothetical protein